MRVHLGFLIRGGRRIEGAFDGSGYSDDTPCPVMLDGCAILRDREGGD